MVDAAAPDEVLVAAVRGALDSGPVTPSPASVYALRLAVLEKWAGLDATPARSRAGWWSRRSAVVAVVTAAFTLGGGTVALARPALPRPLRDAARMAGLPVNPEPAARVQIERNELERSLDVGNVTRVQTDLEDLDRAESKLPPTQRARAQVADDDLEQRARTAIGGGSAPAPVGESEGSDTAATPAPARPEPTEAQPASSPPAPAAGDDRSPATTTPGGHDTRGDGSGEPAPAPPQPSPQETTTTTASTTTQPPSSSDDGHSMSTSTSSTGSELLQTTTVDH